MRIRKLAKELGVDQELLLALAAKIGLGAYTDADQQLSSDSAARLKIEVRKGFLARGSIGITTKVPRSDFLPKAAPRAPLLPDEREALKMAFIGVKPMEPVAQSKSEDKKSQPKLEHKADKKLDKKPDKKPEPPPEKPALKQSPFLNLTSEIAAPAAVAAARFEPVRPRSEARPEPAVSPSVQTAELLIQVQTLKAQLLAMTEQKHEVEGQYRELVASTAGMGTQLARALRMAEEAQEGARVAVAAASVRMAGLEAALAAAVEGARQASSLVTLKSVFEDRGLKGEDEVRSALVGLLESRRAGPILSRLVVEDVEPVRELLREKLVLLAEGDEEPAGSVVVRVGNDRSEGEPATAIGSAIRRFNTVCLVYNKKRIVIVGGWPAAHARLKEGLDSRLNVRLLPGDRRGLVDVPSSDLTVLWASTILDHTVSEKFSDGVVIPYRGLGRMLNAVSDYIEGKTR